MKEKRREGSKATSKRRQVGTTRGVSAPRTPDPSLAEQKQPIELPEGM
jgi:hypothetical protein